jgi:replicative DNA helicase
MHNYQAECEIIGCFLLDNELLKETSLTTEHFYDFNNKQLFSAMKQINQSGDPVTVGALAENIGESGLHMIGGQNFLERLKNTVASIHAFASLERMVIDGWKKREIKGLLEKHSESVDLNNVQNLISEINKIDQTGTKEVFNLVDHLANLLELPYEEVPKGFSGIPSGFNDLDFMTDGFQNEDSIIVGARPSMGKTAFVLNIAKNAGLQGVVPIIFSLEMSSEALIKRMLSCIGEIDGIRVRNPYNYFDDEDKTKWGYAITEIGKIPLQIFDKPGQKVSEMRAKIRQLKKEYPNKKILVMIDYLTLITPASEHNGNAHLQVSEISNDIKTMAKEFKCPIITLAQLSRGVESRQNKRPTMSDLRESGSIEQDADIVAFLYRDEYYNDTTDENKNVLEIDIAKQRNGPTGSVKLLYKKEINRIENLYHYHKQKQ